MLTAVDGVDCGFSVDLCGCRGLPSGHFAEKIIRSVRILGHGPAVRHRIWSIVYREGDLRINLVWMEWIVWDLGVSSSGETVYKCPNRLVWLLGESQIRLGLTIGSQTK